MTSSRKKPSLRVPTFEEQQERDQRRQDALRDASLREDDWIQPDAGRIAELARWGSVAARERPVLKDVLNALEEDRKRGVKVRPDEEVGDYMARRRSGLQRVGERVGVPARRRVVATDELDARARAAAEEADKFFEAIEPPLPQRPTLTGLTQFADWCPLDLRKRLKALAGDYDAEIIRLHGDARYPAARWNKFLAWTYALWYVLRSPLDRAAEILVKAFTGK